jgi:hypothetical protein
MRWAVYTSVPTSFRTTRVTTRAPDHPPASPRAGVGESRPLLSNLVHCNASVVLPPGAFGRPFAPAKRHFSGLKADAAFRAPVRFKVSEIVATMQTNLEVAFGQSPAPPPSGEPRRKPHEQRPAQKKQVRPERASREQNVKQDRRREHESRQGGHGPIPPDRCPIGWWNAFGARRADRGNHALQHWRDPLALPVSSIHHVVSGVNGTSECSEPGSAPRSRATGALPRLESLAGPSWPRSPSHCSL